eukprot:1159477-Pelagomonas_calceolata.AAC.2
MPIEGVSEVHNRLAIWETVTFKTLRYTIAGGFIAFLSSLSSITISINNTHYSSMLRSGVVLTFSKQWENTG